MDGVSRVIYLPQLNKKNILPKDLNFDARPGKLGLREEDYIVENVFPGLREVIESVESGDEGDICLGYCLTHLVRLYDSTPKIYHEKIDPTIIVFPLFGEQVKYNLIRGDFFSNQGNDPTIVNGGHELFSYHLLFGKDPHKNREEYEDTVLVGSKGLSDLICEATREEIDKITREC